MASDQASTGRVVTDEKNTQSMLYELPNVMITPRIAGSLGAERLRMSASALDDLDRLVAGEPLRHLVRREELAFVA